MAERLFKFLGAGAVGRFSGFSWPPGEWVSAPVEPCVSGLHLCRPDDLPYWLDEELWEVDVDGAVVEHFEKVVVGRARIVARIARWPDPLAGELAADCLAELERLAARESEADEDSASAARLRALLDDARDLLGDPAATPAARARNVAYVAAYAADRARPEGRRLPPGVTPFAVERQRQAALLVRGLDL